MKFKDKYVISKEFENLFSFQDEKEELDHEARMLMFRFLSEIEKNNIGSKILKNKDLAKKLGVSPSYITQLLRGDKLMNLTMLAKIQKVFDITFEIRARENESLYSANALNLGTLPVFASDPDGLWVWHRLMKPDYNSNSDDCDNNPKGKDKPGKNAA
jgi:transcriptional regulator with XRE-family HTH domain